MSFKISNFKANSQAVAVNLRHPETGEDLINDEGTPVQAFVYGKASKKHRDLTDARLQKAIVAGKDKNKAPEITVDKIRKEGLEWAVGLTSKITGIVDDDGNEIDTPETITAVLSNPDYYWVLDQINAAIENDSNFFKP